MPAGSSQPPMPLEKAAGGRGAATPVTRQLLPLHALHQRNEAIRAASRTHTSENQTKYSQVCSHEPAQSW